MSNAEIVMKLIGEVSPVGKTEVDAERLENLESLLDLIDTLLFKVETLVDNNKDAHEMSIKKAVQRANRFLYSVHNNTNHDPHH